MKTVVFSAVAAACCLLALCMPQRRIDTYVEATIPVAEERLSLSPLIMEATFEHLTGWPRDPERQKILLENFTDIWKKLLSEFRRCQKYGLYTVVDDNADPTIRIAVVVSSVEIRNDTLFMPGRIEAERLRDDQRFTVTVPVVATVSGSAKSHEPFHYYGNLMSDYSRRFPFTELVSYFYRHKLE